MNVLVQKLRKAREQKVEVGGYIFTVRRPTIIEMAHLQGAGSVARLLPYVVDWEGVREIDITPGGDPHPLPFDADVCTEWLCDRPDLMGALVDAIMESYRKYDAELASKVKN